MWNKIISVVVPVAVALIALLGVIYVQKRETKRRFNDFYLREKFNTLKDLNNSLGICWQHIDPLPWARQNIESYWSSQNPTWVSKTLESIWEHFTIFQNDLVKSQVFLDKSSIRGLEEFSSCYYHSLEYLDSMYGIQNFYNLSPDKQEALKSYMKDLHSTFEKTNELLKRRFELDFFIS